jgi:[acyl-carrier-protein] S-malonyltransferase
VTLAILCSGQGAQHSAMFELTARCVPSQSIFKAATSVLGSDPRQWVQTATPSELFANESAQLLCCTQALAAWAALAVRHQTRDEELVIAGYSVGELASWGCAGLIQAQDLLHLAKSRAQAMSAAAGADSGLVAIRGLSRASLEALCRTQGCEIAIVLSEDHFIVGGRQSALAALREQALRAGAQRSTALPIAVAAHTSLLAAASSAFSEQLASIPIARRLAQGVRLLSGVDGDAVLNVNSGIEKLARQISHTLDWYACLTACREAGVTRVLELGPGRALASMAREALPQARCRALDEFKSLEGVRAWLQAERDDA